MLYAAHRQLAAAPEGTSEQARAETAFEAALEEIDAHRRIQDGLLTGAVDLHSVHAPQAVVGLVVQADHDAMRCSRSCGVAGRRFVPEAERGGRPIGARLELRR